MKRCKAFTLAEVLITLTIIGVIAALTIPNLLQKHQEHELITRLKKAHSVISNAYAQAIRENGPAEDWDIGTLAVADGATKLYNYLKPYLKVQKECGNQSGCLASSYKALFNDNYYLNLDSYSQFGGRAVLDDGMSISMYSFGKGCTSRSYSKTNTEPLNQLCGYFYVDINGKTRPNKVGVDAFAFLLTQQGSVIPFGVMDSDTGLYCKYTDTSNKNGAMCTAWALYKGNMDYLRRDISTEWTWLK